MEITAVFLESATGRVSVSQQGRLCPGEPSAGELSLTGNVEPLRDVAASVLILAVKMSAPLKVDQKKQ